MSMRCLRRNKRQCWFALFERTEYHYDEYGNMTSEHDYVYGNPVPLRANISPAKNADTVQLFGVDINYDKVLVMGDPRTPIDEYSVFWVDVEPVVKQDGSTDTPYDYVVRRVARSLTSVSIALAKVDVSGG